MHMTSSFPRLRNETQWKQSSKQRENVPTEVWRVAMSLKKELRMQIHMRKTREGERSVRPRVRSVRARSARISIYSLFHVSITLHKLHECISYRSLIPQENRRKSSLECKIDYDENLTRASRSNTVLKSKRLSKEPTIFGVFETFTENNTSTSSNWRDVLERLRSSKKSASTTKSLSSRLVEFCVLSRISWLPRHRLWRVLTVYVKYNSIDAFDDEMHFISHLQRYVLRVQWKWRTRYWHVEQSRSWNLCCGNFSQLCPC